jgi:hypothetical protein
MRAERTAGFGEPHRVALVPGGSIKRCRRVGAWVLAIAERLCQARSPASRAARASQVEALGRR